MKRGWDLTDAELQILAFIKDRSLTDWEISEGLKLDRPTVKALLVHLTTTRMLSGQEETGGEWRYVLTWRAWEESERKDGRPDRDNREKNSVLRWLRRFFDRHGTQRQR